MPKPITVEMLHAMSLDQRKNLHRNALSLDTPAAHEILELLSQDDLMGKPKAAAKPATARKKSAAAPKKAKVAAEAKPTKAVHGRRA